MALFMLVCSWPACVDLSKLFSLLVGHTLTQCSIIAECEGVEESGNASGKEGCSHARYLQENPVILKNFTTDLLPLLLQIYGSTVAEKVLSFTLVALQQCNIS